MQRKNNFLKSSKNGIAMIMAIAVILIISTILALSLTLTTQTTKNTTDIYLYEQANLLARSALEYTQLKIGTDNTALNRCAYTGENFVENTIYNITISVEYIYDSTTSTCGRIDLVQTEPFGVAQVDVTVEVNDPTITLEPIRIFKRKLIEL